MFFLFKWVKDGVHAVGDVFHKIKVSIMPAAVGVLQAIKTAEDGKVVDAIAGALDAAFHTGIFEAGNDFIKKAVHAALATALSIEGLPDNPTEDQVKKFDADVVTAILGKKAAESIPGQVYSNLVAQLYVAIDKVVQIAKTDGGKVSAGEIIKAGEEVYQKFLQDQADAAAAAQTTENDTPNA